MDMDTAEMQRKLEQSLAHDRVVVFDARQNFTAHKVTAAALEMLGKPFHPSAIVVSQVWDRAQHANPSGRLDKKRLVGFADAVAKQNSDLAQINVDDLLRIELALTVAFDTVFPKRSAALEETNRERRRALSFQAFAPASAR